jgi:hypothetical protein
MLFLRLLASSFAVSWNFTWEYCLETKDMNSTFIPDLEFSVKSSKGYAKRTVCMLKPGQINYLYYVLLSEIWSQQMFIEMANIGDFILDPEGKNVKDIKNLRKQRLIYFNQQISNTTLFIQRYSLLYPSKNDSEDDFIISEDDITRLL